MTKKENMRKRLCIIFMALIVVSCVSPNFSDNVVIHQTESDYPVVINRDKEGKIFAIFYLTYDIRKKSMRKIRLSNAKYYSEKDRTVWYPVTLYSINSDSLVYVNDAYNKKRFLRCFSHKYVVRERHYVKNYPDVHYMLEPYLEKMKSEHKDTLHIGNIRQLMQNNPELMSNLLQGDSIKFVVYYNDSYHSKILPVEIK